MERVEAPAIDSERPWPGLVAFDEAAEAYFHGRDDEVLELLRLIRRDTLTVLFGQSGLGKSSLLNAGVLPRLRREEYFPIYIRLDLSASALPLGGQVAAAMRDACRAHRIDAPPLPEDMSLWEYFHRDDVDFWSPSNQLLKPVLIFDQFEELFTLGRHSAELRARCAAFLGELANLIEDRMPVTLRGEIERNEARADGIDDERSSHRVVLSLREDYLAEFEGLKGEIRRIMHNRMRLLPMPGHRAAASVLRAGRERVTPLVAETIVRFVGGGHVNGEPLEEVQVEPALLSLVCRELNEQRIARGDPTIAIDLLHQESAHKIIENYYEECFAGIPAVVRKFIEDRLLTRSGYRDSCAVEEALAQGGVEEAMIDALVLRRLIRYDIRHGVRRIELTHDVLTEVARRSRDERQAKEVAEEARRSAEAARAEAERLRVLHADAKHYFGLALAEKAQRADRDDHRTIYAVHALANLDAQRAPQEYLAALGHRLAVLTPARQSAKYLWGIRFLPKGQWLAVNSDDRIELWDLAQRSRKADMTDRGTAYSSFEFTANGAHLVARNAAGGLTIWDIAARRTVAVPNACSTDVNSYALSPSGRYMAVGGDTGRIRVLRLPAMEVIGSVRNGQSRIVGLAWGRAETSFISFGESGSFVWHGAEFSVRQSLQLGACDPLAVRQASDVRRLAVIGRNRLVFFYELIESDQRIDALGRVATVTSSAGDIVSVAIAPRKDIVAMNLEKSVRLLDWRTGKILASLPCANSDVSAVDFSSDARWLAAMCRDASWFSWELPDWDWSKQTGMDERALSVKLEGVTVRVTRPGE